MPSTEVAIISLLASQGHGTPEALGWHTPIPVIHAWLHASLIRAGHVCDWADPRASASGRYALRAEQRFQQLQDRFRRTA